MSTDDTTPRDDTDAPTRDDVADALDATPRELRAFRERHPDPDPHTVLGRFGAPPGGAQERLVAAWLGDDVDTAGGATGASAPSGACERDGDPSDDAEPDETADAPDPDDTPDTASDDVDARDARAPALEAFADAIDYFHAQLDRDLPEDVDADTPREYYEEHRRLEPDTVGEKRLGYAPDDAHGLLDHLMRRGHDREAILGTGLFWADGLDPIWRGRFVFPYFDADGRPVYAISRRLEPAHPADGAGKYDPDDDPAKYHKIPDREHTTVEEPIYGLGSLEAGEPVIITEGIADAIAAHEAGYPALSPVTTQFKHDHRDALAGILADRDVGRVVVAQDAEPPSVEEKAVDDPGTIGDALAIAQHGEGLRGAVDTAAYLREHGVEAYLAELPRLGLAKVDLDDYIHGWGDTWGLAPILASAQPPAQHRAHDPMRAAAASTPDVGDGSTDDAGDRDGGDGAASSTGGSDLWALTITDIVGEREDYRGPNPLGHHGDSENYFVFFEKGGATYAYDHKYKTAYTPLTYLLADAPRRLSGRTADDPNGSLDDDEILAAWVHAKGEGLLPDDDPIPHRALLAVAFEADLADRDDLTDGWKLPADAYNRALERVRERFDVDPGRAPIGEGGAGDGEPAAALPLARLAALDDDDARRFARRHGVEWPDTDEVRDRLEATVRDTLRGEEHAVVEAPTAAGKSHLIAATPWRDVDADVTGGGPVVQLHETREARDQLAQRTADTPGVEGRVLRAGPEACPVAGGRHDPGVVAQVSADRQPVTIDGQPASEWFDDMTRDRGIPFSVAHARARDRNDQGLPELPCCPGEQICHSQAQYAGIPRNDDGEPAADVIHATHAFAHVPSLRHGVNLVVDEQPGFAADLSHDRATRAVSAFLSRSDDGPDTWEELVATGRQFAENDLAKPWNEHVPPAERADMQEFQGVMRALEHEPPQEWYFRDDAAHTLARPIAQAVFWALYQSDPFDRNGRATARTAHSPPRFDDDARDDEYWNRERVTVVLDKTNRIRRIRAAPDFSGARAVVGLDAHPTTRVWRRNVGSDVTRERVLDADERRLWRIFERGLRIAQVGDAVRPQGREGQYYDREGDAALVAAIREEYGPLRSGVVPKAVRDEYAELLEEHGADVGRDDDGDPARVLTFGSEKSRDDLAGEGVGYVSHAIDPGDEYLIDWLAECGLEATPSTVECPTCDGDGCDECDGTGARREHGRTFDGPDADAAGRFLATVREQHLIQSAGRYARNPDDPTDGATVFVRSAALPDEYADVRVPGVEWLATDRQRAILRALRRQPSATARELADDADVSKEHVRKTLRRLADTDAVEVREHAAEHGAHAYRALAGVATAAALVDLEPDGGSDETTNADVWDSSTWSLAVSAPNAPAERPTPAGEGDTGPIPPDTPRGQTGLEAFDRGPPGD